jgi:signal transduction histidine kinase
MVAVATLIAAPATLAVALDPSVRFAYQAPELRTALETAQALIAATAAYLIYGRVRRRPVVNDLALVFALGLFGASNLFFAALPATGLDGGLVFQTWAPLANRLIACAVIAYAALAPDRPLSPRIERPGIAVILTTDIVLALVAISVAALSPVLPSGVMIVGDTTGAPELDGHPVLLGAFFVMAALSAAASVGFARRSEGRRDPLTSALAVGSVLQAFAFLCFALYPSIDTEIVQSGDALRLGFYLVLLIGGEREIDRYWKRLADIAIYDERRRLARDLHDGVAQELAFVVTQTRLLQRGTAPPETDQRVAAAAERALDESRRAIIALTLRDDEPLGMALTRAAEDVAGRVGVDVRVQIDEETEVAPSVREGLVRIVQESVSNAGRHGKATNVRVTLGRDGILRIVDNGSGFDTTSAGDGRFGLVSMRERAERMGGRLTVESEPGRGTKVEVSIP